MGFFTPSFMDKQATAGGGENWLRGWLKSRRTASGIAVDQRAALNLSAVLCATRVISEAISSLPLNLIEMVDDRHRRIADDHPLQTLMHDQPNPEQDSMSFFDQLIPWQVNAGTAFAEIQRDGFGKIVALWPIHPSRVKCVRNNRDGVRPEIGDFGEMVFHVRCDDHSTVRIPASSMLAVPGVLSDDGTTGRGLVELGCESLGVAMAVEQHAGAFFRNGAVPGIFVNYEGKLSAEKFDALRASWEKRYEGVGNHYKSMLIDGGKATAQILGADPEKTQLLGSRNFSTAEVSRIWRVPLHMLSDLSRSTWGNVEHQGIDFVTYSLRAWIVRLERGMNRQLLTAEERKRYYFRFNLNALLRGDSAARASYYQTMQSLGVYSINEIRDLEDLDPIENGDLRFIPANNMQPLDSFGATTTLTDDAEVTDVLTASVATGAADVQATALNGAQVTSMVAIADKVVMGEYTADGAQAMFEAAFPAMDRDLIRKIVTELSAVAAQRKRDGVTGGDTTAARRVAAAAITHTLDNLVRYEVRRLDSAAKKPGEFMAWMDDFYAKGMPDTITSTAEPVVVTLATLGVVTSAGEIAAHYCEQSKASLDAALSSPAATFAAKVKEITDGWSGRAATLTIELMGDA